MRGFHLDGEALILAIMESTVGMAAKTARNRSLIVVLCSKNLVIRYQKTLSVRGDIHMDCFF